MTKFTHIIAIIDKSGSMEAISEDTIDGFNQFLDRQIALEGEASITAVLFNDKVDVLTRDAALDNARLTPANYLACGSTALYDAIGQTLIHALQDQVKRPNRPDETIVVILTDGEENASVQYRSALIAELIDQAKTNLGWSFMYFGANIDAIAEASKVGLDESSAFQFKASGDGIIQAYSEIHTNIAKKRGF